MDTVMENLVRQFPIIPLSWSPHHDSSLSLLLEVLSFELKRSVTPSRPCSQNPHVSSQPSKTSSSAPNDSSHTLSPSYLEERILEYFTLSSQNDTSTQETTLTEASSISQENIITQEVATTKGYTRLQENIAMASIITQDNIATQAYTTTEAGTITEANYSAEGSFKCSLCDLVFRTEAELRTHKMKPHRYNLPNKKFLSPDNPRIGQVNSIFLCPHCADLIPFNGRHKHMIAHQIDSFKSQWQNCERAAPLQQADGSSTSVASAFHRDGYLCSWWCHACISTGMDTTRSRGIDTTRSRGMDTTRSRGMDTRSRGMDTTRSTGLGTSTNDESNTGTGSQSYCEKLQAEIKQAMAMFQKSQN